MPDPLKKTEEVQKCPSVPRVPTGKEVIEPSPALFIAINNLSSKVAKLSEIAELLKDMKNQQANISPTGDWFDTGQSSVTIATPNKPINADQLANVSAGLAGYDAIRVKETLKRKSPRLHVICDGPSTLYVVSSVDGTRWTDEIGIPYGEARTFYDVYEIRVRSPNGSNLYHMTEREFWLNNTPIPEAFLFSTSTLDSLALQMNSYPLISGMAVQFNTNYSAYDIATLFNSVNYTVSVIASTMEASQFSAANVASVFNDTALAVSKAALIFANTNLSVIKAAAICESANLSVSRLKSIFSNANISSNRVQAILYQIVTDGFYDRILNLFTFDQSNTTFAVNGTLGSALFNKLTINPGVTASTGTLSNLGIIFADTIYNMGIIQSLSINSLGGAAGAAGAGAGGNGKAGWIILARNINVGTIKANGVNGSDGTVTAGLGIGGDGVNGLFQTIGSDVVPTGGDGGFNFAGGQGLGRQNAGGGGGITVTYRGGNGGGATITSYLSGNVIAVTYMQVFVDYGIVISFSKATPSVPTPVPWLSGSSGGGGGAHTATNHADAGGGGGAGGVVILCTSLLNAGTIESVGGNGGNGTAGSDLGGGGGAGGIVYVLYQGTKNGFNIINTSGGTRGANFGGGTIAKDGAFGISSEIALALTPSSIVTNPNDFTAQNVSVGLANIILPTIAIPAGFGLIIRANVNNTGQIFVSRTDATVAANRDTLNAGDFVKLYITNANLVNVAASLAAQSVDLIVEQ